jgi:hypothetical protein
MRVLTFVYLSLFICATVSLASADELQQSPHLARVSGVALLIQAVGNKPCELGRKQLTTDAKFALSLGSLPTVEITNRSPEQLGWPLVSVTARAIDSSNSCIWDLAITLSANVESANVLDLPYSGAVDLWKSSGFGIAPGKGLTRYVSENMQKKLKMLIDDIRASEKRFPQ